MQNTGNTPNKDTKNNVDEVSQDDAGTVLPKENNKADNPIAVLLVPVVLEPKALLPTAALFAPSVLSPIDP